MRERNETALHRLWVASLPVALFTLWVTLGSPCFGQTAAVVRVYNSFPTRQGLASDVGTGTLVSDRVVLTCGHLVRDGIGQISVRFSDGRTVTGQLIKADQKWDLAAISIPRTGVTPVRIANRPPKPGDSVESSGYGSGSYRTNRGRVLEYVNRLGVQTRESLKMTGHAPGGDSGGPIVNRFGELVAVIWGSVDGAVYGTYCGRILSFLQGVLPNKMAEPQRFPLAKVFSGSKLVPETTADG